MAMEKRVVEIGKTEQALLEAPVIHIDGAMIFGLAEGLVRFNLFQNRMTGDPSESDGQPPVQRVVCARLVMAAPVAKRLADWLTNHTKEIEEIEEVKP